MCHADGVGHCRARGRRAGGSPARTERVKIISKLSDFNFDQDCEATVSSDKDLVRSLIVEMIRNEEGNENKSEADCIKAFNLEVQNKVAPKLNRLLAETETTLTASMLLTAVSTIIVMGAYAGLYALDIVRSPIDEGFTLYVINRYLEDENTINMQGGASIIGTLAIFGIIMFIVSKKWDDKPK